MLVPRRIATPSTHFARALNYSSSFRFFVVANSARPSTPSFLLLLPNAARPFHSNRPQMSRAPRWSEWRLCPPSATPSDSTTFRNQAKLPRLPIPELDLTLDKLVESCRPLAKDENELQELKRKVSVFRHGLGRKLQQRLVQRRESEGMRNWIAEWWDNDAYMAYRDSVVVNVSYYYGFKKVPQAPSSVSNPPTSDPAYVAASIIITALEFRRLLIKGLLEPEPAGKEGELCMESFKWAFNANRIPAKPADYAVKVREDSKEGQHVVVVLKERFYKVPLVDREGREFTVEEMRRGLQGLLDKVEKEGKGEGEGVGILTGLNRDTWTDAYEHLIQDAGNKQIIDEISKSAFVVAFDQHRPEPEMEKVEGKGGKNMAGEGIRDFSERLWKAGGQGKGIGEGANRWWDKPQQWVVFANGESGFIGEHSCMDGTPTARLSDFVSKRLITRQPVEVGSSDPAPKSSPTIEALDFHVDAQTKNAIEEGKKEFEKHVGGHEVFYLHYGRYGKEGIKRNKTSPDGWVQMAFQLAYYMTHGKPCGTYEAAQVRRFQLGRTGQPNLHVMLYEHPSLTLNPLTILIETVRICTSAALAFAQAMTSPSTTLSEKRSLFAQAVAQHGKDMKAASFGLGIDRHLFGLKHLFLNAEEASSPSAELFQDRLLKRSSTWTMSTSQIFIEHSPAYGWGRVDPDGYGIPYMVHKEHLQFSVTCERHMKGREFIANLGKAADMIMDMMEASAADAKA
ncbi:BZ3500_MvSof-1268-A1-R1_Chr8-1g09737 [Microbotryum saponariae]|uniref:BZ3500_MvSof-1268-A1-R1_Chr8-1g09737 protein n=1 Tax=Microbotryum saponariae TaxID=289078 RepID=A0A2X0M7C2_9BASI|nr:BZ3500_MvSof-1268-A1-R1_Chr8-1g09737 [Microbotryum saponariae]SDA08023.1 BZ3501_MvSof-1269-A2-R1_Chr8-1g09460 [Microbotryum saponariae]